MEKKKSAKIIVVLLGIIAVTIVMLFYHAERRARKEWAQQGLLAIDYRRQNGALPIASGYPFRAEYYMNYDAVDEAELYVYLAAYNEDIQSNEGEGQELTLEDFKDYLASEYNADGSLRIQEGYENIRAYVDWYWTYGGAEDIEEYWGMLETILGEFREQNPGFIHSNARNMDIAQLQELINKKNDPSYEINSEVMKGKE